jgi:hypothetical protein
MKVPDLTPHLPMLLGKRMATSNQCLEMQPRSRLDSFLTTP